MDPRDHDATTPPGAGTPDQASAATAAVEPLVALRAELAAIDRVALDDRPEVLDRANRVLVAGLRAVDEG